MINVFITVDVEIWCDGWNEIDTRFPSAFRKYIYGPTPTGDYGLPIQLNLLNDHGINGVFFVEPLFSARFGLEPLKEIVSLIQESNQEVQLHLHTEWVDEARQPLLPNVIKKRQHLRFFNLHEQTLLIKSGLKLLNQAGALPINAFRAGSFAFNVDTLKALATNGIIFDSSYNASKFGLDSGVMPGKILLEPVHYSGVIEYPMTVYQDGTPSLRHIQLTACSIRELEALLWKAYETGLQNIVILSHSFELLNTEKNRPDPIVVKRFEWLCDFLDRNRDVFNTQRFTGLSSTQVVCQPKPLKSNLWRTSLRMAEQVYRRRYG
ncbi:polysaccharide deacetylase family protein [Motiliproteus sediminis]|uniref:polysaccharide deacetylase family protein n=1 Tax=Motiliproteus sediminis TaxID=1468178 RepID=UPI001AF00F70|nr:hypothetical protein [Motiliproteus sediminis]